ncbi:MAG: hypothetical protein H7839_10095 [Magnetococcus sp. YQC-5]
MHKIIFYPVGNGDTTLIDLSNERRVLFDFCHRKRAEGDIVPEIDLKTCLNELLSKTNHDYLDVVAFTHADLDHIQGSTEFFELQHAKKYQGEGRIKIRQLWVPAAMLLETTDKDHQQEEFVLLRQEARYRLLEGNSILVFSKPPELVSWLETRLKERGESTSARDHLFIDAGTLVPGFSLSSDGVEFFCHSPFIKHCDEGETVRNRASLIFNVRFRVNNVLFDYLEVGDATWEEMEDIVRVSRHHGNGDRLAWDLYNIPHHCSYLALNEEGQKGEKETEPKPMVKELLLQGKRDAYIVSCSKPIADVSESYDQIQPPHIQSRKTYERYLKEIGGRKFLVTMEEPNTDKPEPIVFEITGGGATKKRSAIMGAPAIITSIPPRAG